jgi:hypothetical protein
VELCLYSSTRLHGAQSVTSAAPPQTACLPSNPTFPGLPYAIAASIRKPLYNYHSIAVTLFVPRTLCLRQRHSNLCPDLLHACAQNVVPIHNSNADPVTTNTKGMKRKRVVLPTAGHRRLADCAVYRGKKGDVLYWRRKWMLL